MPPPATRQFKVDTRSASLEVFECGEGDSLALCLHGFPEHAISWRHQAPLLADLGYRVWMPNLRGYGRSSLFTGSEHYRLEVLVEDLSDLMTAAQANRVLLVGHDWGATIGWYYLMGNPQRLPDGFVAINSYEPRQWPNLLQGQQIYKSAYLGILLSGMPELLNSYMDGTGLNKYLDFWLNRIGAVSDEAIRLYRWNISRPGGLTAMLNYYRANLNPLYVGPTLLSSLNNPVHAPVLLMNGKEDPFIGSEMYKGKHPLTRDLESHEISGGYHWLQQEKPQVVNELIEDWLIRKNILSPAGERVA